MKTIQDIEKIVGTAATVTQIKGEKNVHIVFHDPTKGVTERGGLLDQLRAAGFTPTDISTKARAGVYTVRLN